MSESSSTSAELPAHTRVVVIGGGNLGVSVLYHLAILGWTDVVLLEKAELTSGATWHAAGLVSRMTPDHTLGSLYDYAVEFYRTLEQNTGQAVSWHGCGSLRVATSAQHRDWLAHTYDAVRARGHEIHLLDPSEFSRLNPLYDVEKSGITQAIYTPGDGHVDPASVCNAMATGARGLGARIVRRCRATNVRLLSSGEWEVETDRGRLRCEHVINAAGYHARQVGAWCSLEIPVTIIQHHYFLTEDVSMLDDLGHEIPVTRDDYFCGYIRQEQDSALIGVYDKQAPKVKWPDGCPWESEHELFDTDWDNVSPWLEKAFERCPSLSNLGIRRVVNGGITYTPDGSMLLGPAPGLRNYWLACGTTAGIGAGPGVGRTLAEWIIEGTPNISTRALDPRRFGVWADEDYARARAVEDYAMRNSLPLPGEQRWSVRNRKLSGVHERTRALGAVYEEVAGWERPRWYALDRLPATDVVGYRPGRHRALIRQECLAVRRGVGIGDFSAFAKFEVDGVGARRFLDRLCANRIAKRPGRAVLTQLLNPKGTVEGEAIVVSVSEHRFYLVTGSSAEHRLWDWMTIHQRGNEAVSIENRSDAIGVITIAGPRSREVLARCTEADLSNEAFPWLSARSIQVAGTGALALRMSYTGSLAWELHAEHAALGPIWDALWYSGQSAGIRAFGAFALNSLRMEKGYRGGSELSNDITPIEAGLERLVCLEKDFIGKEALLTRSARREGGVVVMLDIAAQDVEPLGGEAVFVDGELVGSVTSVGYGHFVDRNLAFVYVSRDVAMAGRTFEVLILGRLYPAALLRSPPFDPGNSILRS